MNPGDVAPMVVGLTFIIMGGLVVLLRPISKKLGNYLEVMAEAKRRSLAATPASSADTARIVTVLDTLDRRLAHLEERQDFTDKLLVDRTPR
jgi:hypothetical protein